MIGDMTQLVITAVGPDKPGIVGEISSRIHSAGGNILDSRMVNLRGQFSLMALIEVDEASTDDLNKDLSQIGQRLGLVLNIIPQINPSPPAEGLRYRLKTYSADQPGIVARLTGLLRSFGINIEELSAWQESAPFAGHPIFLCEIYVTVPSKVSLSTLRSELNRLCDELNCDLDLEPFTSG
jgi:glycine cleavage system transcriptional repressor